MHAEGQHRSLQQPQVRQAAGLGVRPGGQLPAERAGAAPGAARGLPLLLRALAGAGGVFAAHSLGGAAALPLSRSRLPVRAGGAAG